MLGLWPMHTLGPTDVIAASMVAEENRISFWDAMIVRSAAELGCTTVWTEDLNHGQEIAGVRIANPFVA